MLLRYAKIAGGLRIAIGRGLPILTSLASVSVRNITYLIGFSLGAVSISWWPIIATLINIAGILYPASQAECDAYYAKVAQISQSNYTRWLSAFNNCFVNGSWTCSTNDGALQVPFEPLPCTPPDCNGKKVWLQTIWASPQADATFQKGCFLIAYSYNEVDGLKIEYNQFRIPEPFLISRALPHQIISGTKFKQLKNEEWKDLETVAGWDKGYWSAEFTDIECRGWRPGWSQKVK